MNAAHAEPLLHDQYAVTPLDGVAAPPSEAPPPPHPIAMTDKKPKTKSTLRVIGAPFSTMITSLVRRIVLKLKKHKAFMFF